MIVVWFKQFLALVLSLFCGARCNNIAIGQQAPLFTLTTEAGISWSLAEHKGRIVVLYFYPADNTPQCTAQACSLRNEYADFADLKVSLVGINYDSPSKHAAFKTKHHLPFPLLSDSNKSVAELYNAKRSWFLPFPQRKTIVIDQQGVIRFILESVDVKTHTAQVLACVKQLT
jgi:peroxiredoxin Q/BCP